MLQLNYWTQLCIFFNSAVEAGHAFYLVKP